MAGMVETPGMAWQCLSTLTNHRPRPCCPLQDSNEVGWVPNKIAKGINQKIHLLGYFQTMDQSHTFENGMLMKIIIRQGVHD